MTATARQSLSVNIGHVYHTLGEKQKALEHYQQALLINREVGNGGREAMTLTALGRFYVSLGEYQKALDRLFRSDVNRYA